MFLGHWAGTNRESLVVLAGPSEAALAVHVLRAPTAARAAPDGPWGTTKRKEDEDEKKNKIEFVNKQTIHTTFGRRNPGKTNNEENVTREEEEEREKGADRPAARP